VTKQKYYYRTKFDSGTIREAYDLFLDKVPKKEDIYLGTGQTGLGDEEWDHDTSDAFFNHYTEADSYLLAYHCRTVERNGKFIVSGSRDRVRVAVSLPDRAQIESVFRVFERDLPVSTVQVESHPIKIFIGHGQSQQWRDLKDHLHDQHGFEVIAYETGPRAGVSVKDVLQSVLKDSSFALLVMTAEDLDAYGESHARENVIHELGLFQARLGFRRAVAVVEQGTHEFSNILGVNQIRFSKGNIRETFGDVVATIARELGEKKRR